MKTLPIILKQLAVLIVCGLAYMQLTSRIPSSKTGKTIEDPSLDSTEICKDKSYDEASDRSRGTTTNHEALGEIGARTQFEIHDEYPNKVRSAASSPQGINSDHKNPNSHEWSESNHIAANNEQDAENPNNLATSPIKPEKVINDDPQFSENSQPVAAESPSSQPSAVIHPAVLVNLDETSLLTPQQDQEVQAMAESFAQSVNSAGLDPASAQYREFYNNEALKSDQAFRAKYGERSWLLHHIQAYHLSNPEP